MTVGQLIQALQGVSPKLKVLMQSDPEGNAINNCVALEQDEKGIYLIPDDANIEETLNTPSSGQIEEALGNE